jgi:hypothetical protein
MRKFDDLPEREKELRVQRNLKWIEELVCFLETHHPDIIVTFEKYILKKENYDYEETF